MSYSMDSTSENCYEGTTVLINKLDIRDENELAEAEGIITGLKASELIVAPLKPDFSFEDYKQFHKYLFDMLYDWAGEIRTISISKSATRFATPEHIEENGTKIFERLRSLNYFCGLPKDEFVSQIADLYHTINMLHPFREGNGRTQRVFFFQLIRNAGYEIDYSDFNSDLLMIGTIQAAAGVMDNLIEFFNTAIV